jgi:hypothetical protein
MISQRPQSARRVAPLIALCVVPFTGACFTYAPIEPGDIQPGMGVRARISPAAGERIAPLLGISNPRLLTGTLIASTNDTLIVEVPTAAAEGVSVNQILHQRVSIARGDLRELESRKLDGARTALLAGAGAAIVVTVLRKVMRGNPASEPLPGGGGTDDIVPLFQLRR